MTPRIKKVAMLDKLPTGVAGLDTVTDGGLPKARTTLISGTAGSAKTVLAAQFLAAGVLAGQRGVFVTFEESPDDIRINMLSLGWDIAKWEAEKKWAFVDGSPQPDEVVVSGEYDLGALLKRIEVAVLRIGAERVSLDSLGAIFTQFADAAVVRRELFRIATMLRRMGVTSIMTAERNDEYGAISRFGVEEFVADNVIILRNILEDEKRRRTLETLKLRGTQHHKGEFPFTVMPGEGVVIIPLSAIKMSHRSSTRRVSSGNKALDSMCGGGFFRDSIVLVTGATGCGKTLASTEFIAAGQSKRERCLFFAFEESHDQLFRNAEGWNVDLAGLEKRGIVKVVCNYPESAGLEDHLIRMKKMIEQFQPRRVVVDSLTALERVGSVKGFREFVIGLTSYIKQEEITGLFTATTPTLLGGTSITEAHISTITDCIILLRYVETCGEMRRGITVLKMRGSRHAKEIREFSIDSKGMHIGLPFRDVSGILSGMFHTIKFDESRQHDSILAG